MYRMMDWSNDLKFRPTKRKRESKSKEARKKKHILSEQRRRNHINEAIDTLNTLLPSSIEPQGFFPFTLLLVFALERTQPIFCTIQEIQRKQRLLY